MGIRPYVGQETRPLNVGEAFRLPRDGKPVPYGRKLAQIKDAETGFYYLSSRYYDPEIGRFLNADSFASTGQGILGYNMFAYCNNNSVMFSDSTGQRMVCANILEKGGGSYSAADNNNEVRDVTEEIMSPLSKAALKASITRTVVNCTLKKSPLVVGKYIEFYNLVNHNKPWDIKLETPWVETIGTPFPGPNNIVIFNGVPMTPQMLGNFTYGYLGYAYGFPYIELLMGSYYAAGLPTKGHDLTHEIEDWQYVTAGYYYAQTGKMTGG